MTDSHLAVAILPCSDLDKSTVFYRRLGFEVESDFGGYRILSDRRGSHLHLRKAEEGWLPCAENNPFGLYLYVDDVDAVAERVSDLIIEASTPNRKPWGTYEFAVGDPDGVLVRIGKALD